MIKIFTSTRNKNKPRTCPSRLAGLMDLRLCCLLGEQSGNSHPERSQLSVVICPRCQVSVLTWAARMTSLLAAARANMRWDTSTNQEWAEEISSAVRASNISPVFAKSEIWPNPPCISRRRSVQTLESDRWDGQWPWCWEHGALSCSCNWGEQQYQ